MRQRTCLLCKRELEPIGDDDRFQAHPDVEDCLVRVTDAWGVSIDDVEHAPQIGAQQADDDSIELKTYPLVEDVLIEIFHDFGLARLGGVSTGRGWSSFSLFQRCPYAWYRRHIVKAKPFILVESPGLAIGTLVHAFLALFYSRMMTREYASLTPEHLYDRLRMKANPEFVAEAWRVYSAYQLYYRDEPILPLAVEYDLKDPRTGESCRYDLIAHFEYETPGRLPGTYLLEHKTASRFDFDTLEGWANDGEVIGEVALWKRLGLDKRFGELKGVIVNLLGKQKEPKFHRTIVAPGTWQVEQHLNDLKRWEGLISLARSTDNFPRARNGCIGRYGRCDYFDFCAGDHGNDAG